MDNKILNQYDDEVSLKVILTEIWSAKITIILITSIFAIGSVFYALSLPNQYKATTILAPSQKDSSAISSSLSQFGGLGSLAGLNIGISESNLTHIAKEIMVSRNFIENFIINNELGNDLGAVIGWNEEDNTLIYNENEYDIKTKQWKNKESIPSKWNLYQTFRGMIYIEQEMDLVRVSLEHYSPYIAKEWLDLYLKAINEHMQERQVTKVSNNIEYLKQQIDRTSMTEMQAVFYNIIEEQIKSKMLAEANPDYAFTPVNPSMIPEERSRPKRALLCIFITLVGGMISVIWVFVYRFIRLNFLT